VEFGEQAVVRDAIEAFLDVGIQHIFGLKPDEVEDGFNRIMRRTAWSEPVGIGFKHGFPFRFEGEFDQCLHGAVAQRGDAQSKLPLYPNHLRDG